MNHSRNQIDTKMNRQFSKTVTGRTIFLLVLSLSIFPGLFGLSCQGSGGDVSQRVTFDAKRAQEFIAQQVAFGPRVPESVAWDSCRQFLGEYFRSLGYLVVEQSFTHLDYRTARSVQMTNLIINSPLSDERQRGKKILLAAHWDTRPRCERDLDPARRLDSLPGANDAAAAVAVLMELARMFAEQEPTASVEFVLFDGEDWGEEGDANQYCVGSKEFARLANHEDYRFAIVIDIIAHPTARFLREAFSEKYSSAINSLVWKAAAELGVARFVDSLGIRVLDDHLSLLNGSIPAIDIIDMNYEHWHTTEDLPDKCDSSSLADVGKVLARVVYQAGP